MSTLLTIIKILAMWTLGSVALALCIGPVIRWCLHYKPPELPPLPSGSLRDYNVVAILHKHRERELSR